MEAIAGQVLQGALSPGSFLFLFVVLPVFLILSLAVPGRYRARLLLILSGVYILAAWPWWLPLPVLSTVVDFLCMRMMGRYEEEPERRRIFLWLSVAKTLIMIAGLSLLEQAFAVLPFWGLFICALSGTGAVLEAHRREIPCENSFVRFALYCCFFPKLFAPTMLRYSAFDGQPRNPDGDRLFMGLLLYLQGAFKAFLFGGRLTGMYVQLQSALESDASILSAWSLVVVFALGLYFVMSGAGDMARGLGQAFGIEMKRNFYYPYQSRSVGDFLERFNMCLSDFIRRHVYDRLRAQRRGAAMEGAALVLCGMLMGLWFGLRLNGILWGAYLALFAVLETKFFPKPAASAPLLLRRIGTLLVVVAGFSILSQDSPAGTLRLVGAMLGTGGIPLYNSDVLYILSTNRLVLAVSALLSTSLVSLAAFWLRRAVPKTARVLSAIFFVGLLLLYTALSL